MARDDFNVRDEYIGADNLATYTFSFKIEEASSLLVKKYDALGELDWSIRGDALGLPIASLTFEPTVAGGSVTLAENLPVGHTLVLLLAPDEPIQPSTFGGASIRPKAFEWAFDRLGGQIQRLAYLAKRSLKLPDLISPDTFDPTLPTDIISPGRVLATNDLGTGLITGPTVASIFEAAANAEAAQEAAEAAEASAVAAGTASTEAQAAAEEAALAAQTAADEAEAAASATQDAVSGYAYIGYSARFDEPFESTDLGDTLAQILDLQYTAPTASLSASGNVLREKGDPVTATTLTASVVKRSDPIAAVRFYRGATLLDTQVAGGAIPNGGSSSFAWTGSFSDNTTFSTQVDDNGASGGPSTVTATTTFSFVYPYFYGSDASNALTAAQVAGLTKDIRNTGSDISRSYTVAGASYLYFAQPSSYAAITTIYDANNFDVTASWSTFTGTYTALDGSTQTLRVYRITNPVGAGTHDFRFTR